MLAADMTVMPGRLGNILLLEPDFQQTTNDLTTEGVGVHGVAETPGEFRYDSN